MSIEESKEKNEFAPGKINFHSVLAQPLVENDAAECCDALMQQLYAARFPAAVVLYRPRPVSASKHWCSNHSATTTTI